MTTTIETVFKKDLTPMHKKNHSYIHAGAFSELHNYELKHPRLNRMVPGKLFIKDLLNLNGMQVSLNKFPKGFATPFIHKHKENEELYIFVKGKGQIQVDGEIIDVEEGTCVRCAPNAERAWRNNSNEDIYYIVIQAKENSLAQDTFDDGVPVEQAPKWD